MDLYKVFLLNLLILNCFSRRFGEEIKNKFLS